MKKLIAFVMLVSAAHSFAADVVMSFSRSIYFAPPAMRGTSGVRLLDNGVLESFNNKNEVKEVAQLSPEALKSIESKIKALKVAAVVNEDGPRCSDAPMTKLEVTKARKAVVIYQKINCRDGAMPGAEELIDLGKALSTLGSVTK